MSYLSSYYDIFKVPENASIEEIEKAFQKLKVECAHDESKKDHVKLAEFAFDEIMSYKKNLPNYQARINKSKNEPPPQNREESTRNESTDNNKESANVKNLVKRFQAPHPNTHPNENFSSSKSVRPKSAYTCGGESKINEPDKQSIAIKTSLKNVKDVVRPTNPNLDKTQNRDSSNQNLKTTSSSANNLIGKEQTQSLNFSETKSNDNAQEQLNNLKIQNIRTINNETVNLNEAQKLENETKSVSKADPKTAIIPEPKTMEQKRKQASQNNKKTPTPFVRQRKIVPKCPPLEQEVHLTLEEVFNGGTKTVNVIRKMEMIGKVLDNPKDFPIIFSPGVEADTRFNYPQEGNKSIKLLPGDLVLIIKDRPEQYFKRINQCDVEYRARVLRNIDNANDVHQIDVPMFDNEPLVINIKENEINVDTFQRILGRGLPRTGDAKSRGNLLVRFELVDTLDDVEVKQKINQDKQIKESTTNGNKKIDSESTNSQIENKIQNETEDKVETQKPKRPVTRFNLELTLNEVLKGCKKSVTVDIKRSDRGVTNNVEAKAFEFDIKPGIHTGFEFTFEGKGDQRKDGTLADVVFTVVDAPHPYFTRHCSEIRYVAKVSPSQFENADKIEIPTLEGNTLKVKLDNEIELNMEKRIFGRGLPYPTDTRMRGVLLVQFEMVSEEEAKEFAMKIKNQIEESKNEVFKNNIISKDSSINTSTNKQQSQLPPNHHDLFLSLEEIYRGCLKRHKIKRKITNENGNQDEEDVHLDIPVIAGSIEGTKIPIEKAGDREFAKLPADVIFTVREETHSLFKRDCLDIIYTANITPREAIHGCNLKIPTLNNETVTVPAKGGITPDTTQRMLNHGIPKLNSANERGNMLIRFNILWGKETQPTPPIEIEFSLSLNQILYGDIVKQNFIRKVFTGNGYKTEQKIVNIDVKAGTKNGTKFSFPREGDQKAGKIPADVVFIARDKPHEHFKRNGANLEYTAKISHDKLVNGGNIEIPTLENVTKLISIDQIKEDSVKRISKLGLPHHDNPEIRGDIFVRFDIIPDKPKTKDPDIETPLPLTLDNVLNGCIKRVKINRRFYNKNAEEEFEDKIVEINIKPGTVEDTVYRFVELGDANIGSIPADIVFIARDKPHLDFKRNGADIIYNALITKYENLKGVEIAIPTLNKEHQHKLSVKNLLNANPKSFNGEGLPKVDNPTQRGNLIVNFDIVNDDRKDPPKEINLPLSLENILCGYSKNFEINQKITDLEGKESFKKVIIPIVIKPGVESGRKIISPRLGDRRPGFIPGDVVFIISDEPHPVFMRNYSNLKYIAKITKSQASKPFQLEIPLLNETPKTLFFDRASEYTYRSIEKKGLPSSYNANFRGDIIVTFEIVNDQVSTQNQSTVSKAQIQQQQNEQYQRQSDENSPLDSDKKSTQIENSSKNLENKLQNFQANSKELQIQDEPFYHEFGLTLVEILKGGTKKITYQRKIVDENRYETFETVDFQIKFPPGVETGTEFRYEKDGDRNYGRIPADIVFVIKEIQHEHFKRNGVDLLYTTKITTFDSMMGFEKKIPKLENDSFVTLKVNYKDPVNAKSVKILQGHGLPYLERPDKRGNIVVNFDISGPNTDSTSKRFSNDKQNSSNHGQTSSNEMPSLLNEKSNSLAEKQNSSNEKQNSSNQKQNSSNEIQNSSNEKQNSSNEKQNSSNKKQNSSNEIQNSSNEKQNSSNENSNSSSEKNNTEINPPMKINLNLSLKDILNGIDTKIQYNVKALKEDGTIQRKSKAAKIKIPPGAKTSQQFILRKQGNEFPNKIPSDVVFVIQDKPNEQFVRNGVNIEYTAKITSNQALNGCELQIPTLDNSTIKITYDKNSINSDTIIPLLGHGLPFADDTTKRGDIMVRFEIIDSEKDIAEAQSNETLDDLKQEKYVVKDPPKVIDLYVTLNEILIGCTKEVEIERVGINENGIEKIERKKLSVNIKPGTETGKKLFYEGEGDHYLNKTPTDVIVVVHDKPHPFFKRKGADILYTATISSSQAESKCFVLKVPTLENSFLMEPIRETIFPKSTFGIEGKGLPFLDDPKKRGKLILLFDIIDDGSNTSEFKFNFSNK